MNEDIVSSRCGMQCDSSKVAHRCSLANTFPIAALTSKRLAHEIHDWVTMIDSGKSACGRSHSQITGNPEVIGKTPSISCWPTIRRIVCGHTGDLVTPK
jgi:hypothetical protein